MSFKARFTSNISLASKENKEKFLAVASLDNLKGMQLPAGVNLQDNPDLMCIAFNGFVANECNANDDGMDVSTALAIKDLFLHKPLDVEHNQNYIIGHLIANGWSDIETSALLTDEQAVALKTPVNFCLSALVYAGLNPDIADNIEDSADPESDNYGWISSSWEISFDSYQIVLGSRFLDKATIIKDPAEILKYSKYLRAYGGCGCTEDGTFVGRLIIGDKTNLLPVGFALTCNPAAAVKGLTLIKPAAEVEVVEIEDDADKNCASKNKNTENNNLTVITKDMKIEKIADVLAAFADKDTALAAKTAVETHISESLLAAEAAWKQEKEDKQTAITAVEAEKLALATELEASKKDIAEIRAKLAEVQAHLEHQEAESAYSARAEYIHSNYNLSDAQKEVVAAKLKTVGDDEAYASYLKDFEVMNADKKKAAIVEKPVTETAVASKVETSLDDVSAVITIPNGGAEHLDKIESLAKKMKITVSVK